MCAFRGGFLLACLLRGAAGVSLVMVVGLMVIGFVLWSIISFMVMSAFRVIVIMFSGVVGWMSTGWSLGW